MLDKFKMCGNVKVGTGGYKCPCCGPVSIDKKKFRRRVRAMLKHQFQKEVNE